jgi:hypothetical protein
VKHRTEFFINLTAGLEILTKKEYLFLLLYIQFIRIQSTYGEQQLWEKMLLDLDNNFLMKLAIGRKCCVIDFTSRKLKNNTSRACWQGLSWIKYCLNKAWFNNEIQLPNGMHTYFSEQYKLLNRCTKKKLKYYRKFLLTNRVDLGYICEPTDNDGNVEYYKEIVKKYL